MVTARSFASKTFLVAISLLGWFALVAQFYLIILNRSTSIAETITRYFSFYTILTNLLVTICATTLLFEKKHATGTFFSDPGTVTAAALYITAVSLVYNSILRFLWQPQGLQLLVDELLHTVIPVLFVLFWWIYIPGQGLNFKNIFPGLAYPLAYVILIFIRGAFSGYYPYPFIDVTQLGYSKVFLNSALLVLVFLFLGWCFVLADKYFKGQPTPVDR